MTIFTHFIAISIVDETVLKNISTYYSTIGDTPGKVPVNRLHITLVMLQINENQELATVKRLFKDMKFQMKLTRFV